MEALLGTSLNVFIGLTVVIVGFIAWVTGRALAITWKPAWHVAIYCLLLGLADRFLTFGLFQGELLSLSGYLIDTTVLVTIALVSFRFNRISALVKQYPWIYRRRGLFTLRSISGESA
ncbi:MAG: hypothetical protein DRR03_03620 [Gammaproteobacteria bacterium]|nr:MAG: hypothetical protein DRR03_03620 [Gammaproteobacteria bacterium]